MWARACAGVFGRATELAQVTQRKYNLAMAVVMGRDRQGGAGPAGV